MRPDGLVYLDNAATSWPKPPEVAEAMAGFIRDSGGNPGRSGHRLSISAGRVVAEAREAVARALGLSDPLRVAFAHNATAAINAALFGFLKPGDRVVVDGVAHNACARPLSELARRGVLVDSAPADAAGRLDPDALYDLAKGVGSRAPARLIVVTHGSNVTGALAPLGAAAEAAERSGATLLVDAAQTAGVEDIGLDRLGRAAVAFTGHKAMLGPGGTGGLALGPGLDPGSFAPFIRGGTGSASESEEHPGFMPDRFEAGTLNAVGLSGLLAGLTWIESRGRGDVRRAEAEACACLAQGLSGVPGVRVYGPGPAEARCAVVSFTLDGWSNSDAALILDERYGVLCRVGLHCAPRAHKAIGTFPEGTIRFSPGPFTAPDEVDHAIGAVAEMASERRHRAYPTTGGRPGEKAGGGGAESDDSRRGSGTA